MKTQKFTAQEIAAVWSRGRIVIGNDPKIWRKDICGAWIKWDRYGNRDSLYGWEVDHMNPSGGDSIVNLQPLQWENNLAKSDGRIKCVRRD